MFLANVQRSLFCSTVSVGDESIPTAPDRTDDSFSASFVENEKTQVFSLGFTVLLSGGS